MEYEVVVIAEGLSLEKWISQGEPVFGGKPAEGNFDPTTGFRLDLEPEVVLDYLKPNLVLTGMGGPINLGQSFGLAANKMGIKLGYVLDLWGVYAQSSAIPDFICTIDPLGKDLILGHKPYREKTPRIYITGSPLLDYLVNVERNRWLQGLSAEHRGPVIFMVGQDEPTTPMIEGLLSVIQEFDSNSLIIPRLHPKISATMPDLDNAWRTALTKAPCKVLWLPPDITTQQIMIDAHYTVSIFSNAILEAAILGSCTVSWNSAQGREKMRKSLGGLESFPSVMYGCTLEVNSPQEFLTKVPRIGTMAYDDIILKCKKTFPNNGKNAEDAADAIQSELHWH